MLLLELTGGEACTFCRLLLEWIFHHCISTMLHVLGQQKQTCYFSIISANTQLVLCNKGSGKNDLHSHNTQGTESNVFMEVSICLLIFIFEEGNLRFFCCEYELD